MRGTSLEYGKMVISHGIFRFSRSFSDMSPREFPESEPSLCGTSEVLNSCFSSMLLAFWPSVTALASPLDWAADGSAASAGRLGITKVVREEAQSFDSGVQIVSCAMKESEKRRTQLGRRKSVKEKKTKCENARPSFIEIFEDDNCLKISKSEQSELHFSIEAHWLQFCVNWAIQVRRLQSVDEYYSLVAVTRLWATRCRTIVRSLGGTAQRAAVLQIVFTFSLHSNMNAVLPEAWTSVCRVVSMQLTILNGF